jgi:hypothetical protein
MILDIFSELQRPGPFAEDHEARLFAEAVEQAVLANQLGFGCSRRLRCSCVYRARRRRLAKGRQHRARGREPGECCAGGGSGLSPERCITIL